MGNQNKLTLMFTVLMGKRHVFKALLQYPFCQLKQDLSKGTDM